MALAVVYWLNPEACRFYPRCPLYALTGWQCAGCGTLRALHQLLHGHLSRAIALNPLLLIIAPCLPALALKPAWFRKPPVIWASVALVLAYTLLRNIP
ncbi:MAG: DUF2752 domain-containing protein [Kiritimatiellaeota bacterium]|nr:DUF2752 domain-containing protein [Kiritimatiellota bacterium]